MAVERHAQYFEGVLQLRNPSEELLEFVHDELAKSKSVRIAKEVWTKQGVDLYLSSNKFLLSLGKHINERFEGHYNVAKKLFTRKKLTSKLVYRLNVLFKEANFKRGDLVQINGEWLKVTGMGLRVRLQHPESGKKHIKDFEIVQSSVERHGTK